MKLRTLITAVIALTAATLAATGSASRVVEGPTLGKIAYTNFDARDKGYDVLLARTDGSDATNITHDGTAKRNVDPNWSADGMKVAYTSYNGYGGADIIVVQANGKGAVNLTGPSVRPGILNIHPTWAPDGSIVFASNRAGNFDLYRIGVAATDRLVRMTKTAAPTQNLDPDYSADGKTLVFSRGTASVTGPGTSLFTMRSIPNAPGDEADRGRLEPRRPWRCLVTGRTAGRVLQRPSRQQRSLSRQSERQWAQAGDLQQGRRQPALVVAGRDDAGLPQ